MGRAHYSINTFPTSGNLSISSLSLKPLKINTFCSPNPLSADVFTTFSFFPLSLKYVEENRRD
jgi:hypothetical protein